MYEYEYELEALLEGEGECEWEGECEGEYEGELEGEEFLGTAVRRGWGWLTRPGSPQRRFALGAARAAVQRGSQALGGYVGGRLGQQNLGQQVGGVLGSGLSNLLPAQEFEYELEGEWEAGLNPIRRVYADALMEHLGHAATRARSEAEAEAFIGALMPLAARLLPQAGSAIMRAAPGLVRGLSGVTRMLRRSPQTRPLVRAIPTIARRTALSIARQRSAGRPVAPPAAVRTLAQQTYRVLGQRPQLAQALRHSRIMDRRYHQAGGGGMRPGMPPGPPGMPPGMDDGMPPGMAGAMPGDEMPDTGAMQVGEEAYF